MSSNSAATITQSDEVTALWLMARDGETHTGSHSWKFLLGVVALTLSTSMLIVCADVEHNPFEDDDGFIEDGYIEPGNYREHADADES
uniref:Uncharacterized protein n=1 Tax=Sinocyclocheilus grahami TaxID=75366 RepID=A0A672JTW7_SINGR